MLPAGGKARAAEARAGRTPLELFQQVREETQRLLRRPPRLTAPGLLGCRLEHLAAATGCEETLGWLAEAIAWVTFGMVPDEVMAALRTGEVTAHQKGPDGVRPLIVGPTMRRLGLRALVKVKKPSSGRQPASGSTEWDGLAGLSCC